MRVAFVWRGNKDAGRGLGRGFDTSCVEVAESCGTFNRRTPRRLKRQRRANEIPDMSEEVAFLDHGVTCNEHRGFYFFLLPPLLEEAELLLLALPLLWGKSSSIS